VRLVRIPIFQATPRGFEIPVERWILEYHRCRILLIAKNRQKIDNKSDNKVKKMENLNENFGHFNELPSKELFQLLKDGLESLIAAPKTNEIYTKGEFLDKLQALQDDPNPIDNLKWLSQAILSTIRETKWDSLYKIWAIAFFNDIIKAMGFESDARTQDQEKNIDIQGPYLQSGGNHQNGKQA